MEDLEEIKQQLQIHKERLMEKYHLKSIGIEFIDLAEELEAILSKKVDLISRKGLKPRYLEIIDQEVKYV